MGADLYIEPIYSYNMNKYKPLFDKAVAKRDAFKVSDIVKTLVGSEDFGLTLNAEQMKAKEANLKEYQEYKALQAAVSENYEKMYSVGYFRDSYNNGSLFWAIGLSWWNGKLPDGTPFISRSNTIQVKAIPALRKYVAEAKIKIPEHSKDETDEDVLKYFEARRKHFLEFLDLATKIRKSIRASV